MTICHIQYKKRDRDEVNDVTAGPKNWHRHKSDSEKVTGAEREGGSGRQTERARERERERERERGESEKQRVREREKWRERERENSVLYECNRSACMHFHIQPALPEQGTILLVDQITHVHI